MNYLIIFIIAIICIIVAFILYRYFYNTKVENKVILYYTTDCEHCKTLLNIWDEFTQKMKKNNIEVQKINCEGDKCPEIMAFPTIILHKKTSKIEFDGERTLEGLIKFVEENK